MHYRAKKRRLLVSLAVVLLLGSFTVWYCFSVVDPHLYRKALERLNPAQKMIREETLEFQHHRTGVEKRLVYYKGGKPLEAILYCKGSTLIFDSSQRESAVLEQMDQVEGMVQQEVYTAAGEKRQKIQTFKAQQATYDYTTEKLEAHGAMIEEYDLPGAELPQEIKGVNPIKEGRADVVCFSLENGQMQMDANLFKGTLF